MEDSSFIKMAQDGIVSKIDIDPRLVGSFKRVMKKIQEYFNANGYTSMRNYGEFLEKFLINSGADNLRIYVDKIAKKGLMGFYTKSEKKICINEALLNGNTERLDSTLCHEFIHFLVMHSLTEGDPSIIKGGFINEALTEMLTQQIYPNSNAYDAQVSMHKYANILSGKVNNYSMFLQGKVDARYSSPQWCNYVIATNEFQKDFARQGYINLIEAQTNEHFIQAQRELVELFVRPYNDKSFDEYCECVSIIIDRPVKDQEYINMVVQKMDDTMIRKLNNPNLASFFRKKLIDVRELIKELKKYNGKKVYEFTFAGRKIAIDENLNFIGDMLNISRAWNPETRTFTLTLGSERMELDTNTIDFNLRDIEIKKKLEDLSNYFSKDSKTNLDMIDIAISQKGELGKIEKFTLPIFGFFAKRSPRNIYVATYGDKVVLLNNYEQIGNISNVPLNNFIGMTSSDPKKALICYDRVGIIENGVVFSTLSKREIIYKAILKYKEQIDSSITQEELGIAIQKYKLSEYYLDEDNEEELKKGAMRLLLKEKFNNLPDEEKQRFIKEVEDENDKFLISIKNGKVSVSIMHGKEIISSYKASGQVLYDQIGEGLYNEVYSKLVRMHSSERQSSRNQIYIDSFGNMFDPTRPTRNNEDQNQSQQDDSIIEIPSPEIAKHLTGFPNASHKFISRKEETAHVRKDTLAEEDVDEKFMHRKEVEEMWSPVERWFDQIPDENEHLGIR